MAARVPAKDVLCEAMEYLSKLGSNLRIRSENLKEKKIRREKLNNALAVQKAAKKVLLVCELSKKSLENVETGVRKVLELIDTSQASIDGGKKFKTDNESTSKYFFFEYKSRKLKMKKRISLKHYTSVRVMAKSLPMSMIDNYPVYYDCKLYRLRNKEDTMSKSKDNSVSQTAKNSSISPHPVKPVQTLKKTSAEENVVRNKSVEIKEQHYSIPDSQSSKSVDNIKNVEKPSCPEKDKRRKSSAESSKESSRDNDPSTLNSKFENNGSEKQKSKDRDKNSDIKSSEDRKSNDKKSADECKKSNDKKSADECKKSSDKKSSERSKKCSDQKSSEESMVDHKNTEKCNNKSKLQSKSNLKKALVFVDSSDDENESIKSTQKNTEKFQCNDTDKSHEPDTKKRKLNNATSESVDKTEELQDQNEVKEPQKPVIKCVSLSKLLKPNVVDKTIDKPIATECIENRENIESKENEAIKNKKSEKLLRKEREEEEYWNQKRVEVQSFKPKNFIINLTRLPEFTLEYLTKLGLKKITQHGVTILEARGKNLDENNKLVKNYGAITLKFGETVSTMESGVSKVGFRKVSIEGSNSNDDDLIAEANKVKHSLLNESDSDNSSMRSDLDKSISSKDFTKTEKTVNSLSSQAEQVKNKLLSNSNSDSDSKTSEEAQNTKAKKSILKQSDLEESDPDCIPRLVYEPDSASEKESPEAKVGDKNTTQESCNNTEDKDPVNTQENNAENLAERQRNESTPENVSLTPGHSVDQAKSSLLDYSSDDQIKTPLSQRMTPQSRKKRMRESMHAKKMLLTYSSSDTEDEQLKDVLKEIKHSLLNVSDEENGSKIQQQKLQSSPSSSDVDILNRFKKKHKRKKQCRRLNSQDGIESENSDNSKASSIKMVRSKSKPGNSSCQNSDAQEVNDKDIDGLTNLNTLNKTKARRRSSADSDMSEGTGSNARSQAIKSTGVISEEMLKAETSSDSAAEDNQDEEEDLPKITLPSFNGDGDHIVKEDLLGESDSSVSQNESIKKDDSEDEEQLNSKRRKATTISSDSEVGSSRKKDAGVKMSDFEDSEDSEITRRAKKKKKATDSDASVTSNLSNEGGKKKRRRIKSFRDSDASGSESEREGRNKHGRKNIRKVMGKNQLEEATKKAAREEKERIARIAERQKMYNNLEFDESGKPDEVVLDKVVLDFDPETKEPLIEVDRGLVKKLKPHQANGIKFMWDACFESAKRIKKDRGSGCILAHCMGLGKTLQVVTLTHTLLTHGDLTRVNRVLVVCPLSTVLNWVNEFRMWLKHAETEYEVDVYELSRFKQNSERAFQLSQWFQHGGVCVLGYEMFRNLSADNSKKFKKKMLKNFQEALVDPGPDLVVCDEGHLLKNEKTSLSQSMNRVKTHRRIVLTGTPLQNNLKEYYCMVQFVKPNLLGKYNEYLNRFVNPITNGQYTDSNEHDIKIMKRRSHVLHKMLDGAVQRRDYGVLAPFLPPKHEYVLFITLSEVQTKLYQHYLDNFSRRPQPGKSSGFLFPDFQSLQRIWTHPLVLKYNSERYEIMQQKKRDKEEEEEDESEGSDDFINDESSPDESTTEESTTDDSSEMSDDSRKKSKKKKSNKKSKGKDKEKDIKGEGQSRPRRGTRANPIELDDEDKMDDVVEVRNENPTEWWIKLVTEDELEDMRNSHKLILLFDILRQCEAIGDKLLVFSQSLYSLDLIEHFLEKVDEATQQGRIDEKLGGHVGSWSQGVDYFRLDGSTSCENRSIWCKNFNREDNPRARLFLISTRAGGLGINLVAANRVVIFDVSWNPSHDVQSIFRVYRFGQKKPCYVYRFLAMGTMEEKIYERQVTKQAISKRVIDEQQIDRHYAENDLAELYKFEPQPPSPRPIPPLPKDRLFAEMLREHEAQIYKYHEHDSLLENKEEETLSEEERKAAWEDFENEKNKPPPAPFPSAWPMHNGMVSGLLAQQQLAYAALTAVLRKDMPNLNDNQLRDMIPHIYNANPQLMQKMSELYKYTQPGMMNPAMMNPAAMNAVGGAGSLGAMGGASGLQYEPPWQRQQQQQQQMRLQQLMQHQNPMGAKFYAGGLGSRDPVAMALQQQRAREIMLGNSAGRPRGRPPHAPRPPPAGDVVNLDSD